MQTFKYAQVFPFYVITFTFLMITTNNLHVQQLQPIPTSWQKRQYDVVDGMLFVSSTGIENSEPEGDDVGGSPNSFNEDAFETAAPLDITTETTYNEMIEQALVALGGKGTAVEITAYLGQHYKHLLGSKTKTWKNSVMGCLSANRRNHFAKEPIKENAKRYVWKLNANPNHPQESIAEQPSNKRRKLLMLADISDFLKEEAHMKKPLPSDTITHQHHKRNGSRSKRSYHDDDEAEYEDEEDDTYAPVTHSRGLKRLGLSRSFSHEHTDDDNDTYVPTSANSKVWYSYNDKYTCLII
jgi:hypothetical protein